MFTQNNLLLFNGAPSSHQCYLLGFFPLDEEQLKRRKHYKHRCCHSIAPAAGSPAFLGLFLLRRGIVYTVQKGLRVYQGILHRKGELPREVGVIRLRKRREPRRRNRGERNLPRFATLASALYWLVCLILLLWAERHVRDDILRPLSSGYAPRLPVRLIFSV